MELSTCRMTFPDLSEAFPFPDLLGNTSLDNYTDLCKDGSVAARRPARGVLHAPILEARPHRWRSHRAGRLHWPWHPPGDPAAPDRVSSATAGAAELPTARHPDTGDAAPAAGDGGARPR